jgi:subtilisin family serine protease
MYLLKDVRLLFSVVLALCVSACGPKDAKYRENTQERCQKSKVGNEFIAHWYSAEPTLIMTEDIKGYLNQHRKEINFIEPNYAIKLQNQIGMVRLDITLDANKILNEIGALSAWRQGYLGQNILIAVIDSGIDINNSKLSHNISINEADSTEDLIDNDQNGFVDDVNGWNFTSNSNKVVDEIGHGTSIAGIITGYKMVGESLGIAPRAKILPIDIMSGSKGNEYDARQAVDYAIRMKAQIINNSWSTTCSSYLASAFDQYKNENVIFVNSAGNIAIDDFESRVMLASIDLPNFLNVGSTNLSGKLSAFSGFGKTINMWAPGEQIPVLSITHDDGLKASGTSISAAIVSGAAALVWSAHPNESALQIVKRLKQSASKINGRSIISIDRAI